MATNFHEGDNHGHKPSYRWSDVQKNPNTPGSGTLEFFCKRLEPASLIWMGRNLQLWDDPLAKRHVDWYLKASGADYNEDAALKIVLENDNGVRSAIGRRLPTGRSSGKYQDYFKLEQNQYGLDDARNSWGAIDRLDFEADFDAGTLHVWFKDRYEWHPYYPDLYDVQPGDVLRPETNCLHAAFVEMKAFGAADFWMVGEATVPLKGFIGYVLGGNLPDW